MPRSSAFLNLGPCLIKFPVTCWGFEWLDSSYTTLHSHVLKRNNNKMHPCDAESGQACKNNPVSFVSWCCPEIPATGKWICNNPPLTHTHTHTHPHPTLSLSCGHNPPTPQRTHTQTPCPTPQPPHPGAVPLTFLLIHPPRHYQTEKIERRRRRRARERGKKRSSQNRSAIHSLDIVLHHWP